MIEFFSYITFTDIIGFMGVACVLGAYFCLQTEWLKSDDLRYLSINACGAVLLIVSLLNTMNLASMVIEICWLSISVFGIIKTLTRRRTQESDYERP
ncbi:CBU_0592 family membrane protein [Woodsholea maritima]|uniref:CBU_0592 family membrane protein n=1 Tax=Woodsholea maritima TaxID=240237 RepID=UPI000372F037|nr:hypothetical protein [Woodsholea maritima]